MGRFERYVAIGDSSTEGLDDPDGNGGFRGWADRLAKRIANTQGSLLYANLGIRGRRTRQIREEQLEPAAVMRPDLVTLFSGTNDVIDRRFDAETLAADVEHIHGTLMAQGATVLTFTLPDLTPVMPVARVIADRVRLLNDTLRAVAAKTGATLVDMALYSVASDPRIWSEDRLHANSLGHERIAHALAYALGLPEADATWRDPLPATPAPSRRARVLSEVRWGSRYLVPWMWRHLRGRSSGEGITAKRPLLEAVTSDNVNPDAST
jgi:lysophospholipase L1-like esterase